MVKTYRVVWSIDVEAVSARDAAVEAMHCQGEDTVANVFEVQELGERGLVLGEKTTVDLGKRAKVRIAVVVPCSTL